MSDLIYRQDAVDAIKKNTFRLTFAEEQNCEGHVAWSAEAVYSDVMEGALLDLPSAQPEQRWIPCDKGEPDEDMECWVTVKTTDTLYRGNFTKRYGERRDKGFITSGGFMWWNTALAWMPIYEPEPYRPEGDDKHEG